MVAVYEAGRNAWSCALNANVGRPFVVAGDEAGKMRALHVAKKYQKNGIYGLK